MSDLMIRVYGEPAPWPKKKAGTRDLGDRVVPVPITDDYRVKTVNGKSKKYDRGYKMRWFEKVRRAVETYMRVRGLRPFPAHHPLAIGALFFVTKPKGTRLLYPTGTPDFDNLRYGIGNMLKRTPDVKRGRIPGAFPNGVAFHDDSQLIWTAQPDGELWATTANPPGVLITIIDLIARPEVLAWGRELDARYVAGDNQQP